MNYAMSGWYTVRRASDSTSFDLIHLGLGETFDLTTVEIWSSLDIFPHFTAVLHHRTQWVLSTTYHPLGLMPVLNACLALPLNSLYKYTPFVCRIRVSILAVGESTESTVSVSTECQVRQATYDAGIRSVSVRSSTMGHIWSRLLFGSSEAP